MPSAGQEDAVAVQFLVQPENLVHWSNFEPNTSVETVKRVVGEELQLPSESIIIEKNGMELRDDTRTLASMGVTSNDDAESSRTFDLRLSTGDTYSMPSQIEVVVTFNDDRPTKKIVVGITKASSRKPYLGGFRHKKTGVVYHHAAAQSIVRGDASKKDGPKVVKFHRDCQTVFESTRSAQCLRESGTQMARSDLYIDGKRDVTITPGTYFSSEELHALKLKMTIVLQRHWRGSVARGRAKLIRKALRERREEVARMEQERIEKAESDRKREIERRMNPQRFEDFEILYTELENWRQHETLRIKSMDDASREERQELLEQLLQKETKLLQTIDKLKATANDANREKRIQRMLEMMCAPKKWEMGDGDVTEVHTPFTARAKELMDLYRGLRMPGLTTEERLDVLLHVKWTVKEFDCNLTREIVQLIDREAELLNRGRSERTMTGLRKRTGNLFLQFVETPEFNPEAARFRRVPQIS